jgi:hypothetical protein
MEGELRKYLRLSWREKEKGKTKTEMAGRC